MRSPGAVLALVVLLAVPVAAAWAAPEGQVTWASHVSLVPAWLDPGETTTGTQFMLTFAPIPVEGGTGSPINPLAVF